MIRLVAIVAGLGLGLAACGKQTVGLAGRACDASSCVDGFACLDGICRAIEAGVRTSVGTSCSTALAVAPCVATADDCSQGCRQCLGGQWSECLYDCLVTDRGFVREESCNGRDDDCDGAIDESTDAPSGCSPRYLDLDGDGFGAGEPRCACDGGGDGYAALSASDCNDNDKSIFPGAANVCLACESTVTANRDDDGDGVSECAGDCNDGNANVSPGIIESLVNGNCHDGVDNDCGGVADCSDSNCGLPPSRYRYGRVVTVTPQPSLAEGLGLFITLNHAALVGAGRSEASGDDVRIFARDSASYHELPRELATGSGWNRNSTVIAVRNEHARGAADDDLLLVYGAGPTVNPAPLTDTGVYALRDDFSTNGGLPAPWTQSGDAISVNGGFMVIPGISNAPANPVANRAFGSVTGRVELLVQLYVDDTNETDYGTFFWLGRSLPNITGASSVTTGGAAVALGWGQFPGGGAPNFGRAHFLGVGPAAGYVDHGYGEALHLYRAVVDLAARTIAVTLDGVAKTAPAYGDNAVSSADTLRIAGWKLGSASVWYDFVSVRRMPQNEATVSLGPELAVGPCP